MAPKEIAAPEYKPCVSLDVPNKVAKDMNVGETVTVTLQGKVTSVEQRKPEEYAPMGGSVRLELIGEPKIVESGEFEELADEEG